MRIKQFSAIAALLCGLPGVSQQSARAKDLAADKATPTSTVTGHVYLDDTKGPARKAKVSLRPAASLQADVPANPNKLGRGEVAIGVDTGFDGSFSFSHVPPGTYYVVASCPGYVSPDLALNLAEARSPSEAPTPLGAAQKAAKDAVLKTIPRVEVQANLPATADVRLERGAAVSGVISYDDGSPAAGIQVDVLAQILENGKQSWNSVHVSDNSMFDMIGTDDRGNYRISGLPAGKYIVSGTLSVDNHLVYETSTGSSSSSSNARSASLSVYSGNSSRLKSAIPFSLQLAEERTGEDIILPMSKLHTITGNIVSARDGHVINGGQVDILNADDQSLAGSSSLTEEDSSFSFKFIFDGEYILMSPAAADTDYILNERSRGSVGPPQYDVNPHHVYGAASKPLHVDGDLENVTIAVPEPTVKEAEMFKQMMQEQERQNHAAPQ